MRSTFAVSRVTHFIGFPATGSLCKLLPYGLTDRMIAPWLNPSQALNPLALCVKSKAPKLSRDRSHHSSLASCSASIVEEERTGDAAANAQGQDPQSKTYGRGHQL